MMMNSRYRFLIPNSITFLALACGVASILFSVQGEIGWAGAAILTSYILDLFDGALARRLNAGTAFGIQLDSLTDMVSLGTAPTVLIFIYLQNIGLPVPILWLLVTLIPLAGAFRLARFNLLPAKTDSSDSLGLTISTAGATFTLAVLTDWVSAGSFLADSFFIGLMPALCLLMVSRVPFPPFKWIFSQGWVTYLILALLLLSLWQWHFVKSWFLFTIGYLGVGLIRAGLYWIKRPAVGEFK